jgi:hypothetical protein
MAFVGKSHGTVATWIHFLTFLQFKNPSSHFLDTESCWMIHLWRRRVRFAAPWDFTVTGTDYRFIKRPAKVWLCSVFRKPIEHAQSDHYPAVKMLAFRPKLDQVWCQTTSTGSQAGLCCSCNWWDASVLQLSFAIYLPTIGFAFACRRKGRRSSLTFYFEVKQYNYLI